ncbi:recombination protein RecR [Treponema medium]|uniref:Recombination protein RecR n=2 Tax=Treponema medium TaxID=58231 RepID=A0AA87TEQ2_TREMD|nr:recombination mediator RecR [Treponema medium]EPF28471.1 recombination protein RecR [Treponema medium ATCC 700293]QSH92780.1 recombination protein RecR [Treponema medium]QSH97785.1 recombination protein RecR [Treponema medium]
MNALEDLIDNLCRLPGIGKKSAARLAYHILKQEPPYAHRLADSLYRLHDSIKPCPICGAFTDQDVCAVCSDPGRDGSCICVVEQPQDVYTLMSMGEYRGLFHVLGGVIAPLEGIGPEQLRIASLVKRIGNGTIVKEVILATNPTIEGDTTALYIQKVLRDLPVEVTRLASGLPVGGDLEYTDKLTLMRSFKGRIKI